MQEKKMRKTSRTCRNERTSDSSNKSGVPEKSIEKIKKAIFDGRFLNVDLIADTLVDEYSKLSK